MQHDLYFCSNFCFWYFRLFFCMAKSKVGINTLIQERLTSQKNWLERKTVCLVTRKYSLQIVYPFSIIKEAWGGGGYIVTYRTSFFDNIPDEPHEHFSSFSFHWNDKFRLCLISKTKKLFSFHDRFMIARTIFSIHAQGIFRVQTNQQNPPENTYINSICLSSCLYYSDNANIHFPMLKRWLSMWLQQHNQSNCLLMFARSTRGCRVFCYAFTRHIYIKLFSSCSFFYSIKYYLNTKWMIPELNEA